jgi:hypothetical protein
MGGAFQSEEPYLPALPAFLPSSPEIGILFTDLLTRTSSLFDQ